MELRQLEHFVAVAEEQHFTRAAELLHISQSGLSASVRALETELGSDLFLRSTRRVELTQAGQAFLAEAVRTIASAAAARHAVEAVRGVLRGTVSVGTEQCLGVLDLPHQLADFRVQHPGVEVRLTFDGSTTLVDRLVSGQIDLALIAVCDPAPRGIVLTPLWAEGFVVLCAPDHPLSSRSQVTLDQLASESLVSFLPGWGARVLAEQAFAAADLPHRAAMEVNDVHTLLDFVVHGLGVALVPAHFAHKRPGVLAAVPVSNDALRWEVAAATPSRPSAAASALMAQLTLDQTPTADRSHATAPTAAA